MKPITTTECNTLLTSENCESLPVNRTGGVIESYWEPDEFERAFIAAGGSIVLRVHHTGHPPVSVHAKPPSGNPPAVTDPEALWEATAPMFANSLKFAEPFIRLAYFAGLQNAMKVERSAIERSAFAVSCLAVIQKILKSLKSS